MCACGFPHVLLETGNCGCHEKSINYTTRSTLAIYALLPRPSVPSLKQPKILFANFEALAAVTKIKFRGQARSESSEGHRATATRGGGQMSGKPHCPLSVGSDLWVPAAGYFLSRIETRGRIAKIIAFTLTCGPGFVALITISRCF